MSFRSPAPLPDDVIDRLFSALVVRYGAPFTDRWRDLDLAVVKGDWARELAGFAGQLGALRYALDNLGDKPPTVIDFRKLCNAAPFVSAQPQLESNVKVRGPTAEEREAIASLRDVCSKTPRRDPRQWARDLVHRHETGHRLATPAALAMARDALRQRTSDNEDAL